MHRDEVQRLIKKVAGLMQRSLDHYIGETPVKTLEKWLPIRDMAAEYMEYMAEHSKSISFKDEEGNPVTPEMIADWHFGEQATRSHVITITAVPKYPLRLIRVTLEVDDG
jgi:hypothetical protein